MAHSVQQTGPLPLLSQCPQPAWAQVVEAIPDRDHLDLTAQLQEIATRRHRLYIICCTLRLHAQHYHLRIAGLLPARNKMLGLFKAVDPPCYRMESSQVSPAGNSPAKGRHNCHPFRIRTV